MKHPEGYRVLPVRECKGFVTNVDETDLSENFALDTRGFRFSRSGIIGERDFGTKHRYSSYPTITGVLGIGLTILNGYSLYDPTTGTEHDFIVGLDADSHTHVFVYDGTWKELTRIVNATLASTPSASSKTATFTANTIISNGAVYVPTTDEFKYHIAVNITQAAYTAVIIDTNTATTITVLDTYLGTGGVTWASGNNIQIFYGSGLFHDPWGLGTGTSAIGTNPHIRWLGIEAQRKLNMYFMDSSGTVAVRRTPLQFMKRPQRKYFWYDSTHPLLTLGGTAERWHVENAHAPCKYFGQVGGTFPGGVAPGGQGAVLPVTPTTTTGSIDYGNDAWLKITYANACGLVPETGWVSTTLVKIILEYDGYQYSDPIASLWFSTLGASVPYAEISFLFDAAKMPKNLTAIKVFGWWKRWPYGNSPSELTQIEADTKLVSNKDLTLKRTLYLQQFTTVQSANESWNAVIVPTAVVQETYGRIYPVTYKYRADVSSESSENLYDFLNHNPEEKTRAWIQPRFATKAEGGQGSVIIADEDDRTLRVSAYSGGGAHMDDVFINRLLDNRNFPQKVLLRSAGDLLGLAVYQTGQVISFKPTEIEIRDLRTSAQDVFPADVGSSRSIIETPEGVMWGGSRAIYLLPIDGGSIRTLNPGWQNLFDGSLLLLGTTTQVVTEAYRQAMIAGHDDGLGQAWFHLAHNTSPTTSEYMCHRYSLGEKKWDNRKLSIGSGYGNTPSVQLPVQFFAQKRDKTFLIGHTEGLLKYPNFDKLGDGTFNYRDDVLYDGTVGHAYETSIILHVGSLYGLHQNVTLFDLLVDSYGTTTKTFTVYAYANGEVNSFLPTPLVLPIIGPAKTYLFSNCGMVERLRLKLTLPVDTDVALADYKNWELRSIEIGYVPHVRIGTK